VGYYEDEKQFVRMMVFEYASNGSLFERLHGEFLLRVTFLLRGMLWGTAKLQKPCYLLLTVFTQGLMILAVVTGNPY